MDALADIWPQLVSQIGVSFLIQAANNPQLAPSCSRRSSVTLDPTTRPTSTRIGNLTDAALANVEDYAPATTIWSCSQGLSVNSLTRL